MKQANHKQPVTYMISDRARFVQRSMASRYELGEAIVSVLEHLGIWTTYALLQWSVRSPGRPLRALRPRLPHVRLGRRRLHRLPSKRSHCLVLMSTRTDRPLRGVQGVVCALSHVQARRNHIDVGTTHAWLRELAGLRGRRHRRCTANVTGDSELERP